MNLKDAVIELALVSTGTIVDRIIGYNPAIGPKIMVPVDPSKGIDMNGVGLAAGGVAVALPFFWKSDTNKYFIHFLSGMFADAVGIVANFAYSQEAVPLAQPVNEAQPEQPFMEVPGIGGEAGPKKKPFLQVEAKAMPKRAKA